MEPGVMVPFVKMLEGITEIGNEPKWPVCFYFYHLYHLYTSICIFFNQLLNPKYRINEIKVILLTFKSNFNIYIYIYICIYLYITIKQKITS